MAAIPELMVIVVAVDAAVFRRTHGAGVHQWRGRSVLRLEVSGERLSIPARDSWQD